MTRDERLGIKLLLAMQYEGSGKRAVNWLPAPKRVRCDLCPQEASW